MKNSIILITVTLALFLQIEAVAQGISLEVNVSTYQTEINEEIPDTLSYFIPGLGGFVLRYQQQFTSQLECEIGLGYHGQIASSGVRFGSTQEFRGSKYRGDYIGLSFGLRYFFSTKNHYGLYAETQLSPLVLVAQKRTQLFRSSPDVVEFGKAGYTSFNVRWYLGVGYRLHVLKRLSVFASLQIGVRLGTAVQDRDEGLAFIRSILFGAGYRF